MFVLKAPVGQGELLPLDLFMYGCQLVMDSRLFDDLIWHPACLDCLYSEYLKTTILAEYPCIIMGNHFTHFDPL